MAQQVQDSDVEVWRGRPWVLPYVAVRTVVVAALAAVALLVEMNAGILYLSAYGFILLAWTVVGSAVVWLLWVSGLLVVRLTNLYVLRQDSLEIKTGILTTKNSVIVPTGFSDLEVVRSVTGRLLNMGDITIRTQSERNFTRRMVMVKNPMRIADMIRDVMARQIFKLDERSSGKSS